ncbi:LacI family DNA-binding transcriptional regulator [Salinibacterium sp. M195]|uniref:LacI family DNA-binding transcriptional regulator n=1 Tax=Salinibacterium sp. M195 TaxID=2583374 RepID=UPI001C62F2E6|nr:LacI family DNA-binding transcriptional regulator [Salinibacterium sp. M195]QYH35414.1 LacI family transcriptional regulator [Salinibacterium sp. M195]
MSIHARRPTMNDVAAHAGVSLKTVSRVVNKIATVDLELVSKVQSSIAELGYRHNSLAANLRAGDVSKTIGVITADLSNSFYTTLSSAIVREASAHGYQVVMASSEEDPARERALALDLCQRRVRGLLIVPTNASHDYLREEVELGTPVVFLDRPGVDISADEILVDNRGGAELAIAHLVKRGHRRIGFLFDSLSIYTMEERLAGARAALDRANIRFDDALLATNIHAPEDAATAMAALLDLAEPPTAVLCGNNRSTVGAVEEIWRRGADIDVAGFDDFEMSRLLPRPVATVSNDTIALGTAAAQQLIARIEGDASAPHRTLLPSSLVSRGGWSTAQ